MNLFGKKKAAPPKLSDSIQMLREAMVSLEKREVHLQKQKAQAMAQAKEKVKAKDKKGAMFVLKRAKLFEKQIDQISGKKMNIEMQVMALENAAGNSDLFKVMQAGQQALNHAIKETDVDKVADVMEDINESITTADELGDALSQQIGPVMDEDELSKELEDMENEMNDELVLEAPVVPVSVTRAADISVTTPAKPRVEEHKVPVRETVTVSSSSTTSSSTSTSTKKSSDEERELKELEALMGM